MVAQSPPTTRLGNAGARKGRPYGDFTGGKTAPMGAARDMRKLILRKLAAIVVVLFGLTILVFSLSHATGDPRYLYMTQYTRTSSEDWEAQGKAMGLTSRSSFST